MNARGPRRRARELRALFLGACLAGFVPAAATRPGDLRALFSHDSYAQEQARRRLFHAGEAARAELLSALDRADSREAELVLSLLQQVAWIPRLPADLQDPILRRGSDPDFLVRRGAAAVLGRMSISADAATRLLEDPMVAVQVAYLRAIRRSLLPTGRAAFIAAHRGRLQDLLASPEPPLRELAIDLLAGSDLAAAGDALALHLDQFLPAERELLLDRMSARPPQWPPDTLRELLEGMALPANRWRRRWIQQCALEGIPALSETEVHSLLRTLAAEVGPEQDAAARILADRRAAEVDTLLRVLPRLGAEDTFHGVLEAYWTIRGPAARDELAVVMEGLCDEHARLGSGDPGGPVDAGIPAIERGVAEILRSFLRLRTRATAEFLDTRLGDALPRFADGALVETALQLPTCPARSHLLLSRLATPTAEVRLKAFEGLCLDAHPDHLPALTAALQRESSPTSRSRMIQLLAEPFGTLEPEVVTRFLWQWMKAGRRSSDRFAALSAIPYVAGIAEATGWIPRLIDQFESDAPDRLLFVLTHLGGPEAEEECVRLAERTAAREDALPEYIFMLRQLARLGGTPTARHLYSALDDPRPAVRTTSARSLVQRNDTSVLEHALALLTSLDESAQSSLLRDLAPLQSQPLFAELVDRLAELPLGDESRIALLDVAAPLSLPSIRRMAHAALAGESRPALQLAALEALGQIGDEEAHAVLLGLLRAGLELQGEAFDEEAAPIALCRGAALALRLAWPDEAAAAALEVVLRQELARDLPESYRARTGRIAPTPFDAPLVRLAFLARGADGPSRLQREFEHVDASQLDERFFQFAAEQVGTGNAALYEWLQRQVLRTWPGHSLADVQAYAALPGHEPILQGDLRVLPRSALQGFAALQESLDQQALPPRQADQVFGPDRPLVLLERQRTLATLAVLAESDLASGTFPRERLIRAARTAWPCPLLLASLAEQALGVDLELAESLARQAMERVSDEPEVFGALVGVLHRRGLWAERDALLARFLDLERSGFIRRADGLFLLRQASIALQAGDRDRAIERCGRARQAAPAAGEIYAEFPEVRALRREGLLP